MNSSSSAIMMEDTDDVEAFGSELDPNRNKANRIAIFFHLIFRCCAILSYLLFGFFVSGFIVTFVVIITLLSLDFWTTKNITGRLLVGLRWWNYVDEKGDSHWVYESRKNNSRKNTNGFEFRIFWTSLVITEVLWFVFMFAALLTLKLEWLMVAGIGVCLNGANLYGYIRCKLGAKSSIQSAATGFLGRSIFSSIFDRFTKPREAGTTTVTTNSSTLH